MHTVSLDDFERGWIIGNFDPSLFKTDQFEVAIKRYKGGESEAPHVHKQATEMTVIVSGQVMMNGSLLTEGMVAKLMPGEPMTEFYVIHDLTTVCVKIPCAKDDKYAV